MLARQPARVVDLVQELERAADGAHAPVADALRPACAVRVRRGRELVRELTDETCLLLDLSQRAVLVRLAGLGLSLWKRPVRVAWPVDDEYLETGVRRAGDDAPGRANDVAQ